LVLAERLEQIKMVHLRGQWRDNIPLLKLANDLEKVSSDGGLQRLIEAIEVKIQVFDQLREAMRIAQVGGSAGLNSGSDPVALGPIEQAVGRFRRQITARPDYASTHHWKALIAQVDKYWDKLFADPISVQTPQGVRLIQPQRTNNIMERFFRDFRCGTRRRTGHNSISQFLQGMIADTPLIRNLDNPHYLKILLNGQATLEDRFAQIDAETVRSELATAQKSLERVPLKIRQLITLPAFPDALCRLFQKAA